MNYFIAFILATLATKIAAECPNACSAHGTCGAYDMCTCFRNWMSADCSERVCQFGLAHVDSPKGDLDASGGALTGPSKNVIVNSFMYPFGTTEQYPATTDIAGNVLTNSAHEYRECSNKGTCDRNTGTCACFEGYEGSACQRASCPSGPNGVCSGHGTCESISEIARNDFENVYKLWDKDATMGCVCDAGYEGPDCSQRQCKVGTDPLYFDNNATVRFTNYTFQFYTRASGVTLTGNYSLVFYDAYGEDWQTTPIDWNATCAEVQTALESIPNDVIPENSVRCYKSDRPEFTTYGQDSVGTEPIYDANMYIKSKYTIAFPKNPGKLKQIQINKFLDGTRPTLYTDESASTLGWHIYPNGFLGENTDLVPDRCFDVIVTLGAGATSHYLDGLDSEETKLLKKCLGDSDGDDSTNIEVYNWDYGDTTNPHLIKLQDATEYTTTFQTDANGDVLYDPQIQVVPITRLCDSVSPNSEALPTFYCENKKAPGFYAVLYYDSALTYPFRIFTRAANDYSSSTPFFVYTTKGTLQLVNENAGVYTTSPLYTSSQKIGAYYSNNIKMTNTSVTYSSNSFYGDMSCENNPVGTNGALDCLNKNDYVLFFNNDLNAAGLAANPVYPNIYQVQKVYRGERRAVGYNDGFTYYYETERLNLVLDYSLNSDFRVDTAVAAVYKFYPADDNFGGYVHTGPCAGRGTCNHQSGVCECFNGYSRDDCTCINNLVF